MTDEPKKDYDYLIVTGFPRSGTTLMMHVLRAAGLPWSTQGDDVSGEDHRTLEHHWEWLDAEVGRAVKVLDPQINTPPKHKKYRWIVMRRNWIEQARSVRKFTNAIGLGKSVSRLTDKQLADSFERDWPKLSAVVDDRGPSIIVHFEDAILRPLVVCRRVADFIGQGEVMTMANVIVNRSTRCLDDLMEYGMMVKRT